MEQTKFTTADREALQELSIAISVLQEQLAALKDPLNKLVEVVQIGNGKNSLLTRAALIEDDIKELKKKHEKLEEKINEETTAKTNGKYMLYAALVTGSFGSLATLIGLLIKFFKN